MLQEVWPQSEQYIALISGVILILMITTNPDGRVNYYYYADKQTQDGFK